MENRQTHTHTIFEVVMKYITMYICNIWIGVKQMII